MEAHDVAETPPSVPRYHDRDDLERSVNGKDEQTHDHCQGPTVNQLAHTFLDNLKLRFGDDSSEVTTIFDILRRFLAGQMAKRDAELKMREALGDQADLRQDLMNVLIHTDAKWAPDDFDFDRPGLVARPAPPFLQPDHQPQMRLPPICPSWYADHQVHQSTSPAVLDGYGGHQGFGHSVSPLMHQIPNQFHYPNAFTSPISTESARHASYTSTNYEEERSPANLQFDHDHVQIAWEGEDHGHDPQIYCSQPWSPVKSNSLLGRARSFASDHVESPAPYHDAYTPQVTSPEEEEFVTPGPSILGTPVAVPIGQSTDNMLPPSRKRRRLNPTALSMTEADTRECNAEGSTRASPPSENPTKRNVQRQDKVKKEGEQTQSVVGGPYIHGLCGKGFASRSRVKKHHWGGKIDNLETTSGCWAKHNKPDVSWNEHPSCTEGAPPPRVIKKPTESRFRQMEPKSKAPVAPTMISTLGDLPQTVYEAVNPHQADQYTLRDVGSFHSYRIPTGRDLDSLLTAVNFASRIDAPRPQGRNDSAVVSHLDAQAVAAEHSRQLVTDWVDASQFHKEAVAYGHHHPYTAHGLGISYPVGGVHVPLDAVLPPQAENYVHTPSSGSPQDTNWDRMYQTNDNPGTLEPAFSPYLDQMRRQM